MSRLLLLTLSFLSIVTTIQAQQQIYGGGCTLLRNQIYYIGGQYVDGNLPNKQVFKMDFDLPQSTNSSFEVIEPKVDPSCKVSLPNFMYTNVIDRGQLFNELYVFGGENLTTISSFWYYDTSSDTFNLDLESSHVKFVEDMSNSGRGTINAYKSSWVHNPDDPNQIVLFGGEQSNQNDNVPVTYLKFYEMDWRGWWLGKKASLNENREDKFKVFQDHAAVAYKDSMYIFGGSDLEDNFQSFQELYVFNLTSSTWSTINTSGKIPSPRIGHTATLVKDNVIISGGSYTQNLTILSNTIYTYNLKTKYWNQINVNDFVGNGYRGCTQLIDNRFMIFCFGRNLNSTQEQLDLNFNIQILDTVTWKLLDNYVPNSTNLKLDNVETIDFILVIGAVFIILILIVIFIKKFDLKSMVTKLSMVCSRKKYGKGGRFSFKVPEPLVQPIISDINLSIYDKSLSSDNIFRLSNHSLNDNISWDTNSTLTSPYLIKPLDK